MLNLSGGEHAAEMMRLLVDAGVNANKQNKDGETALMHGWGARRGDNALAGRREERTPTSRTK